MINTDCNTSTNYGDRKKGENAIDEATVCTVDFSTEGGSKGVNPIIWFNIPLSNNKEDDYLTVSFRAEDLLTAIGKAIERSNE